MHPKTSQYELPDYSQYNIQNEIDKLKNFLEANNLYTCENFFSQIRPGDIIDLYTNPPDLKQLYCNDEFKRLSSYTVEDLKTQPFTALFWRSDDIQKALIQKATKVALNLEQAVPWDIENHELIETLHPQKRTFEIELGWVAPCFDKTTKKRISFVSSLRVKLIFEWPEFVPPAV